MEFDSLKNEEKIKRSSSKGDLFFHFPLHAVWKKTNKLIYKDAYGQIAYQHHGRTLIVAGDPAGDSLEHQLQCFQSFVEQAYRKKQTVCGYYFSEDFAKRVPMQKHQAGVSLLQNLKT